MSELAPDIDHAADPDAQVQATPAAEATEPVTADAAAEAVATAAAPDAAAAPAVDHFAAVGKMMDSTALDALAARVISSGGVEGVTFAPDDGGSSKDHAALGDHAAAIQSELQGQADDYVRAQGISNVAGFHEFARAQGSAVLNSTALVLFHSRSPDTALRALVQDYKRTAAFRRTR